MSQTQLSMQGAGLTNLSTCCSGNQIQILSKTSSRRSHGQGLSTEELQSESEVTVSQKLYRSGLRQRPNGSSTKVTPTEHAFKKCKAIWQISTVGDYVFWQSLRRTGMSKKPSPSCTRSGSPFEAKTARPWIPSVRSLNCWCRNFGRQLMQTRTHAKDSAPMFDTRQSSSRTSTSNCRPMGVWHSDTCLPKALTLTFRREPRW